MASNEESSSMNWTVTDMTPEMQQSAMQLAKQALKDSTDFNKVAQILKRDFGKKWGSDWQCVVTDQFDWLPSNWKTEKKAFIFFGIAKMAQHVNGGTLARQAPMAEAAVYIRGLVGLLGHLSAHRPAGLISSCQQQMRDRRPVKVGYLPIDRNPLACLIVGREQTQQALLANSVSLLGLGVVNSVLRGRAFVSSLSLLRRGGGIIT
ncbi:Dynein light chain 2, cytoplasmic [Trichinella sp. T8]|uniref:Dynein light chain 2, cytoplasmic n=1 Tax=Trichinella murrelli TaxID=144512 RepID=A0A0V0TS49_9BILA|nr:Dynein light chain 2, cytoplasmic [Trichinella murrelli]KRZ88013.1 Dynein light chain 2, cytoplasmic [Trichinella sp. T8]